MMNLRSLVNNVSKYFVSNSPMASLWSWALPSAWGKGEILKQYTRYVYVAVSSIAQDAAKLEFEVNKPKKDDTLVPQFRHPFLQLIKRPNPDASQFQFLELHFTFMKICGESFWYLVKGERSKKPKEIYLLNPTLMDVAIDKDDPRGLVKGYVMTKPGGQKVTFNKDEIVHFKMPNPVNPYRGMSVIEAAKVYIETEDFAAHWTRNSIFNSGRPSGILNLKGTIGDAEFQAVKRQFKDQYSGTKNAGKTMLLKGADGIDYQKLGMELGEVALKELKDMARDDIMLMFRVSKTILGITDDVNRANAHEARAVFTENVIKPEMDRFIDTLNAFLMPVWDVESIVGYKDPTLISDADRLEEWKAGHNKWLTTNDIREERGLDPVKGGDVLYQAINLVPFGNDTGTKAKTKSVKKKELREERAEIFKQILFDNQEVWERRYKELFIKEFETQRNEILKRQRGKQTFPDWIFDVDAAKARITGTFIPLGIELMRMAAKYAFDMADNPDEELNIDERVRDYITDRINRLADETSDFSIHEIEETIAQGVQNGESVAKLRDRIREVYAEATKVRAERIARTETLAASNEAANEAYRQSPLVNAKEWSAEADACEFCKALNGKIVGLEEIFMDKGQDVEGTEGGKYLVDYVKIGHPPLHPNCRCAILPVILD